MLATYREPIIAHQQSSPRYYSRFLPYPQPRQISIRSILDREFLKPLDATAGGPGPLSLFSFLQVSRSSFLEGEWSLGPLTRFYPRL